MKEKVVHVWTSAVDSRAGVFVKFLFAGVGSFILLCLILLLISFLSNYTRVCLESGSTGMFFFGLFIGAGLILLHLIGFICCVVLLVMILNLLVKIIVAPILFISWFLGLFSKSSD